MSADCA